MNYSRLVMAAVVAWVVSLPLGYFINTVLFAGLAAANAAAMRPEAALYAKLPYGFAALLIGFLAFAYMYAKGYEGGSGVAEGFRFGILVGILVVGFGTVWQYVMFPINWQLSAATIADSIVEAAIYGAIIGAIYKPTGIAAARPAAI